MDFMENVTYGPMWEIQGPPIGACENRYSVGYFTVQKHPRDHCFLYHVSALNKRGYDIQK